MASLQARKDNHNVAFDAVFAAFTALSTVFLALRLVSRRLKHAPYQLEDYLVVFSWILSLGQGVMFVGGTSFAGIGYHAADLTQAQLVSYAKLYYAASFLQNTALALAKLSILLQLNRIFVVPWFQKTLYVLVAAVILWWFASICLYAFICIPVSSNWKPTIPHHCGNKKLSLILDPLPWIVTDLAVLLIPLPLIRTLHVTRGKKVGLAALFLTGGLTCIVACARYGSLFQVNDTDPTWTIATAAIWNMVETNISVVCACMIIVQPAIKKIFLEGVVYSTWSLLTRHKSTERLQSGGSDSNTLPKHLRSPESQGTSGDTMLHSLARPQASSYV